MCVCVCVCALCLCVCVCVCVCIVFVGVCVRVWLYVSMYVCVCECLSVMHLVLLHLCCGIVVLLCLLRFHSVCRVFWVPIWSNGEMIITPSCTVVPSCTASSPHV